MSNLISIEWQRGHGLYIAASLMAFSPCGSATERTDPVLILRIGQVAVFDQIEGRTQYGLEYRMRPFSRRRLVPVVGYSQTGNGSRFIYLAVRRDYWLSASLSLAPSFAIGSFRDGKQIRLGNELAFRTGIEAAYRLSNGVRIGVALMHVSNGGLGQRNPGTEALVVSISMPFLRGGYR